ncbi:retrovirus-related pol polyprotein from transposon TNT 1-94 [Tanacetum coccineum]|uniref:Retrovirus-related pol polyprotein from transposon TNT 1-94 n=1 Tax=Tanacetum coccineum TaxID=301880 RepID=A0ABQ5I739_9ASTR
MRRDGRKCYSKSTYGTSRLSFVIKEKKTAKDIWDHLAQFYEARSLHNKIFLKRKLYALRMTGSTSVTVNVLSDYLVFDDVVAAILEEETRRNNREDKQTSSRHVEAFGGDEREGNVASTSKDGNDMCCEAVITNECKKRFADVWRWWVCPIKKKFDVFEVFKVYKAQVELDSEKKIKYLRTDNEGEYTGDEFDTFCKQEGIKRQFTTAYTPQHNRVAERMNRTLLELARAM